MLLGSMGGRVSSCNEGAAFHSWQSSDSATPKSDPLDRSESPLPLSQICWRNGFVIPGKNGDGGGSPVRGCLWSRMNSRKGLSALNPGLVSGTGASFAYSVIEALAGTKFVKFPLALLQFLWYKQSVESRVLWLAGRFIETLVARPASK